MKPIIHGCLKWFFLRWLRNGKRILIKYEADPWMELPEESRLLACSNGLQRVI